MNETIMNLTNATLGIAPVAAPDPMTTLFTALLSSGSSLIILGIIFCLPAITSFNKATKIKKEMKKMYALTGKPVIFLQHHSAGMFGSMITPATIVNLSREMRKLSGRDFDLIIHTLGGDLFSSIAIAKMLKSYEGDVNAIIPKYAMSGGTMISMGADRITMDNNAYMGSIDPQVGSLFTSFSARAWKNITKVKGKKADDKSIGMQLIASQAEDMVAQEAKNITGRNDLGFMFRGDQLHSFQFDKEFMRTRGFKVEDLKTDIPHKLVEKQGTKEVYSYIPKVKK